MSYLMTSEEDALPSSGLPAATPAPAAAGLPATVPSWLRILCRLTARLPRGHGRLLQALARLCKPLQTVQVQLTSGSLWLDLRESACIPLYREGGYRHALPSHHILARFLSEAMTVFDVGANIGYFTAFFSRHLPRGGRVIAFEPMPRALRLLGLNAQLCPGEIIVIPSAVGPASGIARCQERPQLDTSYVTFDSAASQGARVDVVTLDAAAERYGQPDLVKLDIEGAELLALRGATNILSNQHPPIVLVEYIEPMAARFGVYSLAQLCEVFSGNGDYEIYRVCQPGVLCAADAVEDHGPEVTSDWLAVPGCKRALVASFVR